jgi:hypothetical protein
MQRIALIAPMQRIALMQRITLMQRIALMQCDSISTGELLWSFTAAASVRSPVLDGGGFVFFGTNELMSPGSSGAMYSLVAGV